MKPTLFLFLSMFSSCLCANELLQKPTAPPPNLLDPQEAYLIGRADEFAKVVDKDVKFSEGPVWRKSTGEVFFTDIPKNAIYRWTPQDGKTLFKRPAGLLEGKLERKMTAGANGLALTPQGELVICDQGNRRIVKLDEKTFAVETLADSFVGKRLNQPNDVCVSKEGEIFFTDPALWARNGGEIAENDLDFNGVYRLSKEGEVSLIDICHIPNGIALSPDEKVLYVASSRGEDPCIIAYTLSADRKKFENKNVFCNFRLWEKSKITGTPDGLAVDKNGYIYATSNGGLHVFSPALKHLGYVEFEKAISNCCIIEDESGEPKELFITGVGAVWVADVQKILKALK